MQQINQEYIIVGQKAIDRIKGLEKSN